MHECRGGCFSVASRAHFTQRTPTTKTLEFVVEQNQIKFQLVGCNIEPGDSDLIRDIKLTVRLGVRIFEPLWMTGIESIWLSPVTLEQPGSSLMQPVDSPEPHTWHLWGIALPVGLTPNAVRNRPQQGNTRFPSAVCVSVSFQHLQSVLLILNSKKFRSQHSFDACVKTRARPQWFSISIRWFVTLSTTRIYLSYFCCGTH